MPDTPERPPTFATRDSLPTRPLPERRVQIPFKRGFAREEYERVRAGFLPQEMEDKWLIYLEGEGEAEGGWLYFHRSWTGFCIYALRLLPIGDGYRVSEAWVNRDPSQYRMTDDEYDADLLRYLIDAILLGKDDVERPVSPLNRDSGRNPGRKPDPNPGLPFGRGPGQGPDEGQQE